MKRGKKTYTVLYQDKDSDFYEKRLLREGTGVISFEKLWTSNEQSFEIGYALLQ